MAGYREPWNIVVNGFAADAVIETFTVFCRVGGCLMLAPGFGSERTPVRVRLGVALAVSIAVAPVVGRDAAPGAIGPGAVLSELAIGMAIGFLGRLFLIALETALTAAALSIGLGNAMTASIDAAEHVSPLAALGTLIATVAVFASDAHLELVRGVVESYSVAPRGAPFDGARGLADALDLCRRTFLLSLSVASPFLVYGVLANLAAGFINRMAPQAPFYFISAPLVLGGGLVLAWLSLKGGLAIFIAELATWAQRG